MARFRLITIFVVFSITFQKFQPTSAKVVEYNLNAYYFEAAPDGVLKQILGVNGEFPGPTIRAKLGDELVIRVTNSIKTKDGDEIPTSVHWHGIEQFRTPWWDGPEYHSHHSWQYVEGFWGLLIIDNTPEVCKYDEEISITLMDWHHTNAGILSEQYREQNRIPTPDSGLINGRGTYPCDAAEKLCLKCDTTLQSPALLTVIPQKIYRIRVINTSARSNFNFSIDGHKLEAIEVDGVDTVMVGPVDSVLVWPAQRYSFLVVMTSVQGEYWIRANMSARSSVTPQPKAILKYDREFHPSSGILSFMGETWPGSKQGRPIRRNIDWIQFGKNSQDKQKSLSIKAISTSDYVFQVDIPPMPIDITKGKAADEKHRMALSFVALPTTVPVNNPEFLDPNLCRPMDNKEETAPDHYDELVVVNARFDNTYPGDLQGLMNEVQYKPENPPVLYRVLKNMPISNHSIPIYTPMLGKVVQVVINNNFLGSHPWHLHGHTYWVLGNGEAGTQNSPNFYNEERDKNKLNINGVRRDTSHTAPFSWMVIRYRTDNPGTWLLHCHINWHLEVGLGAVFIEGEEYARDLYTKSLPDEPKRICKLNGINI